MTNAFSKTTVAIVQTNTQGDMAHNIAEVERMTRAAVREGARFVSLPENVFYMRGDFAYPADAHTHRMECHPGLQACQKLAAELACWIHIGSLFVHIDGTSGEDADKWANRTVLINDRGDITETYDKIHLFEASFDDGECYREADKFLAGKHSCLAMTPFGQTGLSICYDMRFPGMYRELALAGANSFLAPAAFTKRTGIDHWHVLLRSRAIENGAYVIAAAQCGIHPGGRETYGHSLIIDPWGKILAEASAATPEFILADIDPALVETTRRNMPTLKHECEFFMGDFAI